MRNIHPLIFCPRPNPSARLRLFCVPYAGKGASLYRDWPELVGSQVELCAVQLPGRENRLREAPFKRMADAVQAVAQIFQSYLDIPFALFGHSMGALFCFELTRLLRAQYAITPVHLFISAHRAPQLPDPRPPLRWLADDQFVAEICRRYNGVPSEVLRDPDMMELLLPVLRADVEMLETYTYTPGLPFGCPITAFGGRGDTETRYEELVAWKDHTNTRFQTILFSGHHFFLQSAQTEVLGTITQQLNPEVAFAQRLRQDNEVAIRFVVAATESSSAVKSNVRPG